MDTTRFDPAESVITIRISKREFEALCKWVVEENIRRHSYRNKITVSKLARQAIRYCINRKDELTNIIYE